MSTCEELISTLIEQNEQLMYLANWNIGIQAVSGIFCFGAGLAAHKLVRHVKRKCQKSYSKNLFSANFCLV